MLVENVVDFCKKCLQFRFFLYLCNPIIEDHSAQPADTQLVRDVVKIFILK